MKSDVSRLVSRRVAMRHVAAVAMFGGIAVPASAADYPSRPVRLVVSFPPGGPADIVARALSQPLGEALGKPMVIENKPGAGAGIGALAVAQAEPDGHTLLLVTSAHATNVSLSKQVLRYDLLKDFVPISELAAFPLVLVVSRQSGITSVADLIAKAKAKPGGINFASGGNGGGAHLAAESFQNAAGVKMTHIAYKGTAPAVADVAAGHVELIFGSIASVLALIKSGQLVALASTSPERTPALPAVPTLAESGLKGFSLESWFGLSAPKGTPAAIVDQLNREVAAILKTPAFAASLVAEGGRAVPSSPTEFARFIQDEVQRWSELVRLTGASIE